MTRASLLTSVFVLIGSVHMSCSHVIHRRAIPVSELTNTFPTETSKSGYKQFYASPYGSNDLFQYYQPQVSAYQQRPTTQQFYYETMAPQETVEEIPVAVEEYKMTETSGESGSVEVGVIEEVEISEVPISEVQSKEDTVYELPISEVLPHPEEETLHETPIYEPVAREAVYETQYQETAHPTPISQYHETAYPTPISQYQTAYQTPISQYHETAYATPISQYHETAYPTPSQYQYQVREPIYPMSINQNYQHQNSYASPEAFSWPRSQPALYNDIYRSLSARTPSPSELANYQNELFYSHYSQAAPCGPVSPPCGEKKQIIVDEITKPLIVEHFQAPVVIDCYQKPIIISHFIPPIIHDHYETPEFIEKTLELELEPLLSAAGIVQEQPCC